MIFNRKRIIALVICVGLFGLGSYYMLEQVLPYIGIKPWRMKPAENAWRFPKGYLPENFGLTGQKMNIKTADGLNLSAVLVRGRRDSLSGVVVILHGISNSKEVNFSRASILADSGFASLLLDLRAHGESDGEYCTFGFYEKNDLVTVADSLIVRYPGKPLGIWGASLGGAIALQAMAKDPRYSFGIVESTYDNYERVLAEYGTDYFLGLRPTWVFRHVMKRSGEIAGFDPYAINPVEAAARIQGPVLFIHGDKDSRIPDGFNKNNFEALPHAGKQWVLVNNGGHTNLWDIDAPHLTRVVHGFLSGIR